MLSLLSAGVLLASSVTGQVVCSACWFEADRAKVAYGTDEDVACAIRCVKDGIGQSLAVREASGAFALYTLEAGTIPGGKDTFLEAIGARVEAEGSLRHEQGKPVLRVDSWRVIAARGQPSAFGFSTPATLSLPDLSGREQSLAALKGRVVVLNFWATWCKPCVEEMPDLVKLQGRYGAWGVQVVGAAADEPSGKDAVLAFLAKKPVSFPIWLGATTAQMESLGLPPILPGTVVLDRDGVVVAKFAGRISREKVAAALDGLVQGGTKLAAAAPRAVASQVPP